MQLLPITGSFTTLSMNVGSAIAILVSYPLIKGN